MASPHLIGFDARLKAPTRRLGRALGLTGALEPVHEFGDGRSPTRVLRVAQRERPRGPITRHLIFKYGRAALLTREIERFEAIWPRVKATSLFTELLEPAATRAQLAAAPAEIGALAYRDAGTQAGVDDASALGGRFAAALGDPTQAPWPDRCPKQIATGLAGLLDAPELRWGNALAGYYEGRWLPDVEAVFGAAHTRDGSSRLLAHPDFAAARFDDARTETGALDDWCRGRGAIRELRRSGLEVIGRWGGAIWARDEAVEPALRLKLVPEEALRDAVVDVRPGQLVDVWIRAEDVAATRHALYVERARAAAPSWPDAPATLQLGRWRAPNPLHIGADALEAVAEVRCGPAHGDLHPGNILLAGGVPLFIDYGLAEAEAPIGADIARLLGCFVRDALATTLDPPALIEAIAALLGLPGAEAIESSAARRAVGLLTPWRDAWLDVRPETPLAHHLLGFALIGLKWTEDDGRDALRHRACLVLAALAARAALGGSDASDEGDAIDPFAEAIAGQPSDVIAVYRTHLRSAHAHVVPFFQRAGEPGLLEAVFVQLELTSEGLGARPGIAKARCTLEELLAGEAGGGDRWLLLGDPGAGKSTLARRLAADLAQRAGERVCVYVPLAAWAEAAEAGVDPFDFAEQAARACPSRAGQPVDGLAEALRDAAGREPGRVWLLLDGFDEVAPGLLDATRARIEALADTFAQATVAVLSRPIGACALAGFHRARVSALDPPRQRALLERWLGRDRGRRVWAEVDRRPALHDAAGNPLLLSLLAKIVATGPADADLPATRAEVFGAALGLLLDRGHCLTPRGLGPHRQDARRLLRALSLALTEAGGESWSDEALDDALSRLCAADPDLEVRLGRGWTTSGQCLEAVAVQTGILGPHDGVDAPWRYLHRALRERLAAEALVEQGPEAIVARIRGVVDDRTRLGRWGETLGMACVLLDDPATPLAALRQADAALTVRVLPELTGLPLEVALDALWAIDVGGGPLEAHTLDALWPIDVGGGPLEAHTLDALWPIDVGGGPLEGHTWDGEALSALVRKRPAADAVERLMARVTPDIDLDRLAFAHYALVELEAPFDRVDFFARAGRPVVDDLGLVFAPIPAGDFLLGSPDDEEGRWTDEGPQVPVRLGAFGMATTPVTRAQYRRFDVGHECPGGDDHPVTEVTWWRARLFAAWAGADIRLPTEAEWEYACRAGEPTRYWSGDDEADLARVGWYDENSGDRTNPVGEKDTPNRWGLHDMHGNVWEWCRDWYGPYPAPPADGAPLAEPAGPADGTVRVVRGGSFVSTAHDARSACRGRGHPENRDSSVGFRLVRAPRAPRP